MSPACLRAMVPMQAPAGSWLWQDAQLWEVGHVHNRNLIFTVAESAQANYWCQICRNNKHTIQSLHHCDAVLKVIESMAHCLRVQLFMHIWLQQVCKCFSPSFPSICTLHRQPRQQLLRSGNAYLGLHQCRGRGSGMAADAFASSGGLGGSARYADSTET